MDFETIQQECSKYGWTVINSVNNVSILNRLKRPIVDISYKNKAYTAYSFSRERIARSGTAAGIVALLAEYYGAKLN